MNVLVYIQSITFVSKNEIFSLRQTLGLVRLANLLHILSSQASGVDPMSVKQCICAVC